MQTRRATLAAFAGSLALPALARAQALKDVTFITPFGHIIAYAPDYVASGSGIFERNGLRVRIQGGNGSAAAIQQVVAGGALVARTGGIDVVRAVSTVNAPVRAVGTISHVSPFHVVSAAANPILSPRDLVGKNVGIVSAGGGTENYLDLMLASTGIPKDQVKRQVVGHSPGGFDLVMLRRIDAYIVDSGVVVQLRLRNAAMHSFNANDYCAIPGQVYVASEKAIAEQPAEILAYLRSVRQAMLDIAADGGGAKTQQAMARFELPELRQPETATAMLMAANQEWRAQGEAALVRIIPDAWAKGWQEMAAAGLANPGDPTRAYTTAFSEQL